MATFGPYLLFEGNCAEAMAFYQSCLGGELTITTVGDSSMKSQQPPEHYRMVVNARLKSGTIDISASDWLHPTRSRKSGNTVCLYIGEAAPAELRDYFARLSEGADPDLLDSLVEVPFGLYGALTDRYGYRWMFQGNAE
jgi:PhnB protein